MRIYSVGGDSIEPSAKSLLVTAEPGDVLHNLQKYGSCDVFGSGAVEQTMNAIAKNAVIMPAIQPGEGFRGAAGLLYQPAVCIIFSIA